LNRHPVIFVHGLLGWGRGKMAGLPYFEMASAGIWLARLRALDPRGPRVLFPGVGPISSNHDRACELFYQIKGGDVHYGDVHASSYGHLETIPGWAKGARPLLPQWDSAHPAHFVGQAQGASTVRLLQHLLAQGDFFRNAATGQPYPTSADWIRSITTISAIHNGTPTTYILGCSPDDGRIGVYSTAEYLIRTLTDTGARRGSPGDIFPRWLFDLELSQWSGLDRFLRGQDNAAYDLSIHGAQDLDFIEDHDCTYYFSFLTNKTRRMTGSQNYVPTEGMNPAFRYISTELGRFAGSLRLKYPIDDFRPWWQNDGLAPTYTQDVPRWGRERVPERPAANGPFRRGVWNIMETVDMDHMEIVALPHLSFTLTDQRRQIRFYKRLYQLITALD
jgi:triacylglycerol lipase